MTAAHYRDSVVASISGYYKPVPSASVYVYAPGTTTQVTCYSDAATTIPLTQPLAADGSGVLNFYLPAERSVDFLVSGTGIVTATTSNVVVSSPDTLWTGGLTIQGGGETITAGGLTVTAGGLTLSAGNILFTDNTQDIGASGSNRPRSLYLTNSVTAGSVAGPAGNITYNGVFTLSQANSGGYAKITKSTAQTGNPGTDALNLYVRDGTSGGTLKLVVRAGAAGAETTVLDNIPQ